MNKCNSRIMHSIIMATAMLSPVAFSEPRCVRPDFFEKFLNSVGVRNEGTEKLSWVECDQRLAEDHRKSFYDSTFIKEISDQDFRLELRNTNFANQDGSYSFKGVQSDFSILKREKNNDASKLNRYLTVTGE